MASSSWKLLYCPLTRARLQNRNYPAIAVIRKVPGGETVACPHSPLAALSLPHNPCSSMISWQLNPQKNCFSLLQGLGSKIKSSSICSHAKGAIGKAVVCPHCSLTALSSPHTAWCFEVSWRLNPQNIFFSPQTIFFPLCNSSDMECATTQSSVLPSLSVGSICSAHEHWVLQVASTLTVPTFALMRARVGKLKCLPIPPSWKLPQQDWNLLPVFTIPCQYKVFKKNSTFNLRPQNTTFILTLKELVLRCPMRLSKFLFHKCKQWGAEPKSVLHLLFRDQIPSPIQVNNKVRESWSSCSYEIRCRLQTNSNWNQNQSLVTKEKRSNLYYKKLQTKLQNHTFPIRKVFTKIGNDYIILKYYRSCCWTSFQVHVHQRFMLSL